MTMIQGAIAAESSTDSYDARRAAQERAMAESAADPAVRNVHLELARRYTARVDTRQPT